ncbi:ABC transporter permease [Caldicellulosiruptoraceae bacterium PP1]
MSLFSFNRFKAIVKKEFIQIKRDKASFGLAFVAPILMLLLFGYAVKTEVDNVKIGILDLDKTIESRELIKKLENTKYFYPSKYAQNFKELDNWIDKGDIKAQLIIPSGFSKKIKSNKKPQIFFVVDGTDPTVARTMFSGGILTLQSYTQKLSPEKMLPVDVRTKVMYNPSMKSELFTIPGLIGLIMQNITIILTAFAIVREREKGTIEQLVVTPITSVELILGKLVPYTILGIGDFLIALIFGTMWFNVKIKGSLVLLLLMGIGFVICALSIGILISSISKNQLQAMQLSLLFILPSVLLSGFMFPREAMPFIIQFIGNFIPLTYLLVILRGIILKGVGIYFLWDEMLALFILGAILLIASMKRFNKKLD